MGLIGRKILDRVKRGQSSKRGVSRAEFEKFFVGLREGKGPLGILCKCIGGEGKGPKQPRRVERHHPEAKRAQLREQRKGKGDSGRSTTVVPVKNKASISIGKENEL